MIYSVSVVKGNSKHIYDWRIRTHHYLTQIPDTGVVIEKLYFGNSATWVVAVSNITFQMELAAARKFLLIEKESNKKVSCAITFTLWCKSTLFICKDFLLLCYATVRANYYWLICSKVWSTKIVMMMALCNTYLFGTQHRVYCAFEWVGVVLLRVQLRIILENCHFYPI